MNSVFCHGATLNYSVSGRGSLPLLVVGSSIYYPRTFSDRLRQASRLVCADLPHFVDLEPGFDTATIGFELYAECVERIRIEAGLDRTVVLGHSHHGNVAFEYAKRFPGNVSHIVLVCSPPANIAETVESAERYWAAHASRHRKALLESRRAALGEGDLGALSPGEAYVRQYVADAPLYWHDPEYDAAWLWEGMRFRMDAVRAFRNLYEDYEMHRDPALSGIPILAVMGRDDYAVPHTLWQRGRRRLPGVDVRVLERSGHTPQLEQPDDFDELLLAWLDPARSAR